MLLSGKPVKGFPECRRAQDAKRDVQVTPFVLRSVAAFCAPVRPALSAGLDKRPPSPTPSTNGLTACRMPLQIFSAGSGKHTPLGVVSCKVTVPY